MTTRDAVHAIVDRLPEDALQEAEASLGRIATDRVRREAFWTRLEGVPYDDEPLSERETESLRRFEAGERAGRAYTRQELIDLLKSQRGG